MFTFERLTSHVVVIVIIVVSIMTGVVSAVSVVIVVTVNVALDRGNSNAQSDSKKDCFHL